MRRTTGVFLGIIIASLILGPMATATDSTILGGYARKDGMTGQLRDSEDPPHYIVEGTITHTQTGHGTVTIAGVAENARYAGGPIVFGNPTATESRTFTSVATGTATGSGYGTPQTEFQTWTETSGVTVTESSTVTFSDTASVSNTGTWTRTVLYGSPPNGWFLRTATSSTTKTLTGDITGTETSLAIGGTITLTGTRTGSGTSTVTVTGTRTSTVAGLLTMTASGSGTRPASATMTYTGTRSRTATDSGSYFGTATHTGVVTGTATCSGSLTYTATDYLTATVTNKNSNFIVSSTITSITPVINSASFNTQTATLPSGGTKTWTSTLSITGTDVCKGSPGAGDIPCLGTDSRFSPTVIPSSPDVIYAGSNVSLSTGTSTTTMSSANVKDGVKIHASPSATATTTATSTNTLYAADVTIRFGTDSNNVTATSATVASNPYVRANALVTPTAYTIPLAGGDNKVNLGWLPATTTPTASKIPIADSSGKLSSGWIDTATASATSKIVQARTDGKIDASWLPTNPSFAQVTWGTGMTVTVAGGWTNVSGAAYTWTAVAGEAVEFDVGAMFYANYSNTTKCSVAIAFGGAIGPWGEVQPSYALGESVTARYHGVVTGLTAGSRTVQVIVAATGNSCSIPVASNAVTLTVKRFTQ